MPAKRNKIKDQQQEIVKLNAKLKDLQLTILRRDKEVRRAKRQHNEDLQRIDYLATRIKTSFNQEFAWQLMSGDPDNQLRRLNTNLQSIQHTTKKALAEEE